METKWEVTYILDSDLNGLNVVYFIPHPLFDRKEGKYSYEEALSVGNFIGEYKVPQFNDKLEGWLEFKTKLNEEIYNLFKK